MSGIFLSYRRDDTAGWAGRLYEHLVREWGRDQVFMDIDAIAPGEDFREAIARTLHTCDVVLVVIGPGWLQANDPAGNRRLDDEMDAHRTEIVAALTTDIRVIPVLVGGAVMPRASELPPALKDLAYRNAAVIEDRRFVSDVAALEGTMRQFAADNPPSAGSGTVQTPTTDSGPPQAAAPSVEAMRGGATARITALRRGSPDRSLATLPTVLTIAGAVLALVWGALLPRGWNPELWGIRVGAVVLLVVLAGVGLWSREWKWVLAAGIAGVVGLALWLVQLVSFGNTLGHMLSPSTDGIPNIITFVGAALVLVAGLLGISQEQSKEA